jgi:hypothetical protein
MSHDVISNILSAAHLDDRSNWGHFLDGLHCALQIPLDGRTDTSRESFKRGTELGELLMKKLEPDDL